MLEKSRHVRIEHGIGQRVACHGALIGGHDIARAPAGAGPCGAVRNGDHLRGCRRNFAQGVQAAGSEGDAPADAVECGGDADEGMAQGAAVALTYRTNCWTMKAAVSAERPATLPHCVGHAHRLSCWLGAGAQVRVKGLGEAIAHEDGPVRAADGCGPLRLVDAGGHPTQPLPELPQAVARLEGPEGKRERWSASRLETV